ncbi:MAG TPA: hypothetical protein VJL29_15525 [Thermoguttaceae bacterium]|nr:hypothetical protein [Thermoguttaceae bacterium]
MSNELLSFANRRPVVRYGAFFRGTTRFAVPKRLGNHDYSICWRTIRMTINLQAAWIGFFLGCLAGMAPGLFFHGEDWLGGYGSWRRRMIRLAHIAFFGLGLMNLAAALSVRALHIETGLAVASCLLIVGAVSMPAVCYLSAWKKYFRHLFFVPAMSATTAIGLFTWRVLTL